MAVVFVAASCVGGTYDTALATAGNSSPTTAIPTAGPATPPPGPAPIPTAAPVRTATAVNFCAFAARSNGPNLAPIPGLVRLIVDMAGSLSPDNFRAAMAGYFADFEDARDIAPDEIRDDTSAVVGYLVASNELIDEFDGDITGIDDNDPRVLALDEAGEAFFGALERLETYCDVDLEAALNDVADAAGIPDGLPDLLVPPAMTDSSYGGIGGWIVATDATFDEVVAAYSKVMGEPFFNDLLLEGPEGQSLVQAVWNIEIDAKLRAVVVFGQGDDVSIQIFYVG